MKRVIAAAAIALAAGAAGAQSYEQRAQVERTADALAQIDKAGMEKARAALDKPVATTQEERPLPVMLFYGALLVGGLAYLFVRR
jgi:murein L,D-transpeptidase YcbB/YkuD